MANQITKIHFKGSAKEYFGIWIVNMLLSIVTLGIYSAWAKVRDKKYFHHHTLIDNATFGYHAKPLTILKGRVIAIVAFVLYQVLASINPILAAILAILLSIAGPWIIVRGLIFNARNSSHRGLRFDFNGSYTEAIQVFILYPLLYFITFGLAYPFIAQRIKSFTYNHHQFGKTNFKMTAKVKDFYTIYLKLYAALIGLAIISFIIFSATVINSSSASNQDDFYQSSNLPVTPNQVHTQHTDFVLKNHSNIHLLTIGNNSDLFGEEDDDDAFMDELEAAAEEEQQLSRRIKIFVVLFYLAFVLIVLPYTKSRISNLVWNNTSLDHIGFISNQRMRDLAWLYFSNTLAIIFTVGLATPWAKIRLAKYRADHLVLVGETDWDRFVGEKKEHAKAVGEEIAEIFDVDISIV